MKCIVTGGAGFIGSHLVDELLSQGHEVVVIDDFSLGKKENLPKNQNLKVYKKSICDDLTEIFKNNNISVVFHLAALPRVQFSIQNPLKTHNANINGTLNLLKTCKDFGVKRFISSSSSSVYGDQDKLPLKESMVPNPMSPYALHKLVGEHYCKLFHDLYGLETISLRYFNVYGARQNPEGDYACLIPKFIKSISKDKRPTINGDGEQTRDFTFVSDVVDANILAAKTQNKDCFGETFNIGAGSNLSVNKITSIIKELNNSEVNPIYGPKVIEPKDTLADIAKAKMFGWEPKIKIKQGLKETNKFFTLNSICL